MLTQNRLISLNSSLLMISGFLYILIQFIHPSDTLDSVTTPVWLVVSLLTIVMALFNFIGLGAINRLQIGKMSWLGWLGFIMFEVFWLLTMMFSFVEAFVIPELASAYPQYVEGFLELFGSQISEVSLGLFPILTAIAGVLYIVGGLIYGWVTARAKVLPTWIGYLLAIAALATIGASFVPHPADRLFAVPMGLALILMGYFGWQRSRQATL